MEYLIIAGMLIMCVVILLANRFIPKDKLLIRGIVNLVSMVICLYLIYLLFVYGGGAPA